MPPPLTVDVKLVALSRLLVAAPELSFAVAAALIDHAASVIEVAGLRSGRRAATVLLSTALPEEDAAAIVAVLR